VKRERAELILRNLKRFDLADPIGILIDSGETLWLCPKGNAEGCHFYDHITAWPKLSYWVLYSGLDGQHHRTSSAKYSRFHLWWQEQYVYLLERRSALNRAIETMDKLFPLPRDKEFLHDMDPRPEDFGATMFTKEVCIEAIEQWLRDIPNETYHPWAHHRGGIEDLKKVLDTLTTDLYT
jgi:hypothetical protein